MTWFLAVALRPILCLVLLGLICLPARIMFQRFMPDGRLKRLLLREVVCHRATTQNPDR